MVSGFTALGNLGNLGNGALQGAVHMSAAGLGMPLVEEIPNLNSNIQINAVHVPEIDLSGVTGVTLEEPKNYFSGVQKRAALGLGAAGLVFGCNRSP